MKKLLYVAVFALLASCSIMKKYPTDGFSIEGNIVSYKNTPMAELIGLEFALDDNKFVRELTFKVLPGSDPRVINNLIVFLHEKHPDYEIEVNIEIENYGEVK
jgi:hypothetical protein